MIWVLAELWNVRRKNRIVDFTREIIISILVSTCSQVNPTHLKNNKF